MEPSTFILNILAGGLLGVLGQGIRTIAGIKKLQDSNDQKLSVDQPAEPAKSNRIIYGLFIGFIAGGLGILVKGSPDFASANFILAMIAVGYSGADFIEGVMKNYLNVPGTTPKKTSSADSGGEKS